MAALSGGHQCAQCGAIFTAYNHARPVYCSAACKQKAYRIRKKKREAEETKTRSMDLYLMVDTIMADIDEPSRDRFNDRLWKLLDTIAKEDKKVSVTDIIYRAIQNSKYRISQLNESV